MANQFSLEVLFSSLKGLTVHDIVATPEGWIVEAEGQNSAICPNCGLETRSRHSRYRRRIGDLPLQGMRVILNLQTGRWRCRTRNCRRQIFAERLASIGARSRQTNRLSETRTLVGRVLGGRPGQRLLSCLGMPISRHTLLRRVKEAAWNAPPPREIRAIGVDDWAWNKGKSFGTIVVDLERRTVVDVLPTRSAKALSTWLEQHPGVTIGSARSARAICGRSTPRRARCTSGGRSFPPDTESSPGC